MKNSDKLLQIIQKLDKVEINQKDAVLFLDKLNVLKEELASISKSPSENKK